MSALLPLAEAQRRLLALAPAPVAVTLPVEEALGRFLLAPVDAQRTQPAHPLSAMDGWAVRQADMPGPWHIIGESAAGHPFTGRLSAGDAVRISTGAMLPDGADMVLVQEDCAREGDCLSFDGNPPEPPGRHIRRRGLDFEKGARLIEAGARITPPRLALAISAGCAQVSVHRPPSIAIIDSGDELRASGEPLSPGEIPASNGPMLAAMLSALPCTLRRMGPVRDNEADLRAAFTEAADADILIVSGGASVGDHDLVRPVLEEMGAEVAFWRVAIKPGKPIMVARRGRQVVLGLPGNPVSCFVTALLFALPLLRAACGAARCLPVAEDARSLCDMPATGRRAEFARGVLAGGGVDLLAVQDSGALFALAQASALVARPAAANSVQTGDIVQVYRLYGGNDD